MDTDKVLERIITAVVSIPIGLLWLEIVLTICTHIFRWQNVELSLAGLPVSVSLLLYGLFLLALWSVLPVFILALVLLAQRRFLLSIFCIVSIGLYFMLVIGFENWDGIL
jgi:hypothetical protein